METVKTNSIKAWLLAARPKTLAGAAVPVMLGCALAAADGWFQIVPAMLCFLFAFLMQIDANFINDFFAGYWLSNRSMVVSSTPTPRMASLIFFTLITDILFSVVSLFRRTGNIY